MARQYAGILGALAFLTVVARAIAAGGALETAMRSACVALLVFAVIGAVIGGLAACIIDDSARSRLKRELETRQVGVEADNAATE